MTGAFVAGGNVAALFGAAGVTSGAVLTYLAAPAQLLLSRSPPPRLCLWGGALLLGGGALLLHGRFGVATSLFVATALAAMLWSFLPLALALLHRGRRLP